MAAADWTGETKADVADGAEPLVAAVAGMEAELHVSGALFWPESATLVVSDLHLETGSSLARKRVFVPPWDTAATLTRLEAAVAETNPRRIVSLGDSFHDPFGAERLPEPFRARLDVVARGRTVLWITGNHDHASAAVLPGDVADEALIGGVWFRHIPADPIPDGACEVAGHLHPAARILGPGGRTVRRRCFAACPRRLVMPAFGALTGGLDVLDAAFRPIWPRPEDFSAFMIGRRAVYPIPGGALVGR